MYETLFALGVFLALMAAAIGALLLSPWLERRHPGQDVKGVVRSVANIFALMTSLVLGLMINASRNSFDDINRNVHVLAAQVVVLDLTLEEYGPETLPLRRELRAYVAAAVKATWQDTSPAPLRDPAGERLLPRLLRGVHALHPANAEQQQMLDQAQQELTQVAQSRWSLAEQASEMAPGGPFVPMLVAWLIVIFTSFGYRAPRNTLVYLIYAISAALIAGTLYLVIDMQRPFTGPVRVSSAPLEHALGEIGQ